jgi:TRAP transporter TAXI family solute receptor
MTIPSTTIPSITMPSTRRPRRAAIAVVTLCAAAALAACGGRQEGPAAPAGSPDAASCQASPGQITIATGNATGVYYALGGGLASLISSSTPIKATAAETGASVQNIQQLVAGEYNIAFSLADTAADAVQGKGGFSAPQDIQALARIYSNYTHVIVSKASGITTMADFRGKRISTGSPKSGTEVIANRLLQAAGLNPETDVQAQRLELGKTVDGMKDGAIDGFVWSGGLPTGGVTDLFTSLRDQVQFIDVTPLLPAMQQINPVYAEGTVPAAAYGIPADVKTIVVPNLLLVRNDFPAGNACAITKLIFDKKAELEKVHPAAKELDPKVALDTAPVELAPGAKTALQQVGGS